MCTTVFQKVDIYRWLVSLHTKGVPWGFFGWLIDLEILKELYWGTFVNRKPSVVGFPQRYKLKNSLACKIFSLSERHTHTKKIQVQKKRPSLNSKASLLHTL